MYRLNTLRFVARVFCAVLLSAACTWAQNPAPAPPVGSHPLEQHSAPVQLDGETLYSVGPLGPFSAEERAHAVEKRLKRVADDPFFSPALFRVERSEGLSTIYYRTEVVGVLTDDELRARGLAREEIESSYLRVAADAIARHKERNTPAELTRALILLGVATLVAAALIFAIFRLHRRFAARLRAEHENALARQLKERLGFSVEPSTRFRLRMLRVLRFCLVFPVVYAYLHTAFGLMPMTRGYALAVLGYLSDPLLTLWNTFLAHIGDFFFILVVVVLTYYLLKLMRRLLEQDAQGKIVIPGVQPEWALSLYKILRLGVLGIAVVIIFPYIPGSGSQAFKGVSLFVGAVFTIGASSTSASFIGGIVLIFMGAYRRGDRIRIGQVIGDVEEVTLLLTRVRTPKGEIVTLPNSTILSGYLVNYSTLAAEGRLILHTSVTIGYDAPWKKVHENLLEAARRTSDLLTDPKPFVFQKSLDDFFVSYEINAYTNRANEMPRIYSDLHQNIQDTFNESGVEIMSPHYTSMRDGNTLTIPEDQRPKGYRAARFGVRVDRGDTNGPSD